MKAMVLAAGKGTRLRKVTKGEIPKPMVEIGQKPLLEHTLNLITDYNFDEIIINTGYKREKIEDYFSDEINGTNIYYSVEEDLLGTAGAVKKVEERLNERFLLIYGDILTDLDLSKFLEYHKSKDADITMLTYGKEENLESSGILMTNEKNKVTKFFEKPDEDKIDELADKNTLVNAAVFIIEPKVIDYISEGFSDFSKDVFPKLLESEIGFYSCQKPEETYWQEVGNPQRYKKANKDLKEGKIDLS